MPEKRGSHRRFQGWQFQVFAITGTILHTKNISRIAAARHLDQIDGDGNAGELRNMIEHDRQPVRTNGFDEAAIMAGQPIRGDRRRTAAK